MVREGKEEGTKMAGLQRGLRKIALALNHPETHFETGAVTCITSEPIRGSHNCICGARLSANLYPCRVNGVPMILGPTCKKNLETKVFTTQSSSGRGDEGGTFDTISIPEWLASCRELVEREETRIADAKQRVEAYRQTPEYRARQEWIRKGEEQIREGLARRAYQREQERRRMGWVIDEGGLTDRMRESLREAQRRSHTQDLARRGLL